MIPLVSNQLRNQLHILLGDTAGNQLVQEQGHLILGERPAFQQNFADSQYFSIAHDGIADAVQDKTFSGPVIHDLRGTSLTGGLFREESPQGINVPLNRTLCHTVLRRYRRLIDHLAGTQLLINHQHPVDFCVISRHLRPSHSLPIQYNSPRAKRQRVNE